MNANLCLPIELIKYIIQLSLPPLRYSTHRERYDILLACSLVSLTWRTLAEAELMKHLVIKDVKSLELLVDQLAVLQDANIFVAPLSLHIEGKKKSRSSLDDLRELFKLCESVRSLSIVGKLFSTSLFSTFDWSAFANLKSLHLIECKPPPMGVRGNVFPVLTHLTLFCLIKQSSDDNFIVTHFLNPVHFPSLTSLNYAYLSQDFSNPLKDIPKALAEQLTHLALYDSSNNYSHELMTRSLPRFTSLKSLVFRDTRYLQFIHTIPESLTSVTILHLENDQTHMGCLASINQWLRNLPSGNILKTLLFSKKIRASDLDWDKDEHEWKRSQVDEILHSIHNNFSRLGMVLKFVNTPSNWSDESYQVVVEYLNKLARLKDIEG